mmetsp:Transcript_102560/g.320643  ORF Transcript_102560/g.320643 Transcript_102560/m.320643 type:complete len:319 (-) Transcript_102560:205-1161(-)
MLRADGGELRDHRPVPPVDSGLRRCLTAAWLDAEHRCGTLRRGDPALLIHHVVQLSEELGHVDVHAHHLLHGLSRLLDPRISCCGQGLQLFSNLGRVRHLLEVVEHAPHCRDAAANICWRQAQRRKRVRCAGDAEQQPLLTACLSCQLFGRRAAGEEAPCSLHVQRSLAQREAAALCCEHLGRPAPSASRQDAGLPSSTRRPRPGEGRAAVTQGADDEAPANHQGEGEAAARVSCAALQEHLVERLQCLGDDCQQLVVLQVGRPGAQSWQELGVEALGAELGPCCRTPEAVDDEVQRSRLVEEGEGLLEQGPRPRELG